MQAVWPSPATSSPRAPSSVREFEVGLESVTEVAGRPAIVPTISGRGWTFGLHQVALDPFDPLADGFALTDTWGPEAGQIR